MTYITIINSFWDSATTNPLSTGQVSLYFALLHVCNRSNWTEWFQAPNQVLSVLTGLSRSGILKARNELKQRNLIDFRERGTKATIYKITIANSTQDGVQNGTQDGVQNGMQKGVQKSNTLKDIDKDIDGDIPPISPATRFADFLAAYPKDGQDTMQSRTAYCRCLLDCHMDEQTLVKTAANYADWISAKGWEAEYAKDVSNFFRDGFLNQFLPGNYKRPVSVPKKPRKNSFNDFPQHEYDFDALERELLG